MIHFNSAKTARFITNQTNCTVRTAGPDDRTRIGHALFQILGDKQEQLAPYGPNVAQAYTRPQQHLR